jgi:spore coat polysaccharide biosynthesis predicted glycosyltransferase SpsG
VTDRRPSAVFLCRGSTDDGLGHVMRSRTVALAAREALDARIIVIGDACVAPLLDGRGVPFTIARDEAEAASAVLEANPDIIFFDALALDDEIFDRVRTGRTAIGLSPVFSRLDDLDLVFHRTRALSPQLKAVHRAGRLRAGLEYAVVRPGCEPIANDAFERAVSAKRLSLAISMGGGDAGNLTLETLRAVAEVEQPLLIWCLLGEGYGHCYNQLAAAAASARHEIVLAKTSDSMWRVLSQCALAILAGGTVTYEAARAGLPAINLFPIDAHRFLARELIDRGAALESTPDQLAAVVTDLERHRDRLRAVRERCTSLLDGKGAQRIVRETIAHHQSRTPAAAHFAA